MNDGDKSLVVQDETIINVAKRDMVGVVPLYYEMTKAKDELLNSDRMFNALTSAYKANIGIISNEITKIWNNDKPNVDAVKWLCMYNNFVIDYAKTLFLPEKPEHVEEELKKFSKLKLPHFFKYAKDKEEGQIDNLNDSTVNKLYKIIPNKPIQFKKLFNDFNYKLLMNNKKVTVKEEIIEKFDRINRSKKYLINTVEVNDSGFNEYLKNELSKISNSESYICDVLINYLFKRNSINKETLWKCYGEIMYENLLNNLGNTICCDYCNIRVEKKSKNMIYCEECSEIIKKEKTKQRVKKHRSN